MERTPEQTNPATPIEVAQDLGSKAIKLVGDILVLGPLNSNIELDTAAQRRTACRSLRPEEQ